MLLAAARPWLLLLPLVVGAAHAQPLPSSAPSASPPAAIAPPNATAPAGVRASPRAATSLRAATSPGTTALPRSTAPPAGAAPSATVPPAADLPAFDLSRPDIRSFISQASAQGLSARRVIAILAAAEPQPQIVDAMNRPAEKTLQWWEYRSRMLTPTRIEAGAQLWRAHKELLDQIAIEYRVPPEYVIAVLGIETLYGRLMGRYRVIDALATLAFDYPPRANYFRHELTDFLLLAREQDLDPLTIRGSYAGAMGALQFMPSSYRKYAVSERHAGHSDLWTDWGDIFASTANFLHQAGWQYGQPPLADTHMASGQNPAAGTLVPPDHMQLTQTLASLRAKGLQIDTRLPDDTPAILLAAPEADAMHYRVGFRNFYVITRYNDSPLYAMAVCDLAQAIRERIALEAAL